MAARRRLTAAGLLTAALCLSGLGGRRRYDSGIGASAVRWNGRSHNYRNSAFERWTNSADGGVSRRYDGSSSEHFSPYSTSAFSSNFSQHHDSSSPHHHSSRSQSSRRRLPREHSGSQPAARQNRGIEDQGEERASERSLIKRYFANSQAQRALVAVATFRHKIANGQRCTQFCNGRR